MEGIVIIGLDRSIIDSLNYNLALGRIETDIKGDFIYAPHLDIIYQYAKNELWEELKRQLNSGNFCPSLPIYLDVPKPSGLTRPGAILLPLDRLIYQLIADFIAPQIEVNLDRTRVFSHSLLDHDVNFKMFKNMGDSHRDFMETITNESKKYKYAIRTDVASYFETLHHHPLINSLRSIKCSPEIVNLLEKLLSRWNETRSYGIVQRCFPSSLLGNFYLIAIDYQLKIMDIYSVRFVDDIYIFLDNRDDALKTLSYLSNMLRQDGLFLNEAKTSITKIEDLIQEETEVDRMLNEIQEDLEDTEIYDFLYGFEIPWYGDIEIEIPDETDYDIGIIEELYSKRTEAKWQYNKIIKFCLPLLGRFRSKIAIEESIKKIVHEPYLTRIYCSYLSTFINENDDISKELFELLTVS